MKDGINFAKTHAENQLAEPILVNVITANVEFSAAGYFQVEGEFKYEGDNIGAANVWIYTFVENGDLQTYRQVALIKFQSWGFMQILQILILAITGQILHLNTL